MSQAGTFSRTGRGASEIPRWELAAFTVIFFCVAAMFTPLEFRTPLSRMRPFELSVLLLGPVLILSYFSKGLAPTRAGVALVAAALWSAAILAYPGGSMNVVREFVQGTIIIMFAYVVSVRRDQLDYQRMLKWMLIVMAVITAYNIYWHVTNGYMSGWKRLNNPKLIFSYGIPVFFAWRLFTRRSAGPADMLMLIGIFLLLILSGERKAQIGFVIALVIVTFTGYLRPWHLLVAAAVLALPAILIIESDPYLQQQLSSFSAVEELESKSMTDLMYASDTDGTQSNLQREFARRVSSELVAEHPFVGVGTNMYLPYVIANYAGMPGYMLLGIHDEFMRVKTENGYLGWIIYVIAWVRTVVWGVRYTRQSDRRLVALYWITLLIFYIQCSVEGSGLEAQVAATIMALMPELFETAMTRTARTQDRPWLKGRVQQAGSAGNG